MTDQVNMLQQVRMALERFQSYYTRRDPQLLDEFLELLVADEVEVIGTNGVQRGVDEWYIGKAAARELFLGDWQYWGELSLDVPGARILVKGEVAWLSATGTVRMMIPAEQNYAAFLERVKQTIEADQPSAEQKLLYILRGGNNTLYELRRGERFTWPLRFTAVLGQEKEGWKFQQMQFSFPTVYFPDVRLLE